MRTMALFTLLLCFCLGSLAIRFDDVLPGLAPSLFILTTTDDGTIVVRYNAASKTLGRLGLTGDVSLDWLKLVIDWSDLEEAEISVHFLIW